MVRRKAEIGEIFGNPRLGTNRGSPTGNERILEPPRRQGMGIADRAAFGAIRESPVRRRFAFGAGITAPPRPRPPPHAPPSRALAHVPVPTPTKSRRGDACIAPTRFEPS